MTRSELSRCHCCHLTSGLPQSSHQRMRDCCVLGAQLLYILLILQRTTLLRWGEREDVLVHHADSLSPSYITASWPFWETSNSTAFPQQENLAM